MSFKMLPAFIIISITNLCATNQQSQLNELAQVQNLLYYSTNLNEIKNHSTLSINLIEHCLKGGDIQTEVKKLIEKNNLILYKKNIDSTCSPLNLTQFTLFDLRNSFKKEHILDEWNKSKFSFEKNFETQHTLEKLSTKLYILFYIKGVLDYEYAWIHDNYHISNLAFKTALEYVLNNTYPFHIILKNLLVKLKDPHVTFDKKGYQYTPPLSTIINKDSILLFPFDFSIVKENVYAIDRKSKQVYLLNAIDTYSSKQLYDSTMFFLHSNNSELEEQNAWMHFSYVFFTTGEHTFSLYDTLNHTVVVRTEKRNPQNLKAHVQPYRKNHLPDFLKSKKRINFMMTTNRKFIKVIKSLNDTDTLVIDFTGYPFRHISALTRLLPNTEKTVAHGLFSDHPTGCFTREEEYTYNKKNIHDRISTKNIIIYGRINCYTASYVETSVMILKTYLPNFLIVGSPSSGARGTIEWKELPFGMRFSYPYHKFEFTDKTLVNEFFQIIPDILYYNKF